MPLPIRQPVFKLDSVLHLRSSRDFPSARSDVVTAVNALIPEAIKAIFFNITRSLSKRIQGFKESFSSTLWPLPLFIGESPYENTGSPLF